MKAKKLKRYQVGGQDKFGVQPPYLPQYNQGVDNTNAKQTVQKPLKGQGSLPMYNGFEQTKMLKQLSEIPTDESNYTQTQRETDRFSGDANRVNESNQNNYPVDTALYAANLKMLKENGSPRIDYDIQKSTKRNMTHFNAITNNMTLNHATGFIDELAHAHQRNVDNNMSSFREIGDWVKNPYINQKQYDQKQYTTPGSIENDAHQVIAPVLQHQRDSIWVNDMQKLYDKQPLFKQGGRVTNTGYLPDSPDRFNDYNVIPSNQISMRNVKFPIQGTDNLGNQQMMYPGGNYSFPGSHVMEVPMKQYGGGLPKAQNGMAGFGPWLGNGISANDQQNQDDYNTQQIKNSGNFNQGLPQIPGYSPQMIPSNALAAQGSSINSNYRAFPAVDIFQPPPEKTGLAKAWDFTKKYGADIMQAGLGAVGNTLTDLAAKRNERAYATHLGGSDNLYTPYTSQGNQGDYDPNTGAFRPNQKVATQFSATPYNSYGVPTAAYGGNVFQNGLPKAGLGLSNDLSIQPMSSSDLSSGNMSGFTLPGVANINEGLMPGTPMTPMPKFQMPTADYGLYSTPSSATPAAHVNVNANTKTAYDYYTQEKGLAPHIAAGIVGNLFQESGLNPGAKETTHTANGRGIAQWDVRNRWPEYLKWATENNRSPYDLKAQLDYVLVEPKQSAKAFNLLKNTTTADQATEVFGRSYESPSEKHAQWDNRKNVANQLYAGKFEKGGEYDMDDATIKHLTSQGYTIDHI